MENTEVLQKRLKSIFSRNEAFVVTLNGEWGVGKTYFWHKFKDDYLKNKKVAYVSLFGKDTIQDIRANISLQVITRCQFLKIIQKFLGIVKIPYINLSSALALLSEKEFKNIIVCFDDFERLSKKLVPGDILGLIAELKEQKRCKVMMILNQDKSEHGRGDFSTYKDKIVDYEFEYAPTPYESFRLIQNELTAFKTYPLEEYFRRKNINNIRIMRRVINALNDFSFIEERINNYEEVKKEIVGGIIGISAINSRVPHSDFEQFIEYSDRKLTTCEDTDSQNGKNYGIFVSLLDEDNAGYFLASSRLTNDLGKCVIEYGKTSIVDEEEMHKIVTDRITNQKNYQIRRTLDLILEKDSYDMSYTMSQYVSDLWNFMKTNAPNNPASYAFCNGMRCFISLIKELERLDKHNKEQYHGFAVRHLKGFFEEDPTHVNIPSQDIENIVAFDPELRTHIDHCNAGKNQQTIDSEEKIIKLMLVPIRNESWSNELDLLAQVPRETIKKHLLGSQEFLKTSYDFLAWHNRILLRENFSIQYKENLISVYRDIASTSTDDNCRYKMRNLLKRLNISYE